MLKLIPEGNEAQDLARESTQMMQRIEEDQDMQPRVRKRTNRMDVRLLGSSRLGLALCLTSIRVALLFYVTRVSCFCLKRH